MVRQRQQLSDLEMRLQNSSCNNLLKASLFDITETATVGHYVDKYDMFAK